MTSRRKTHRARARTRTSSQRTRSARKNSRRGAGRPVMAMGIIAAVLVVAIIAGVGYALGLFKDVTSPVGVARHIVYSAPTANVAAITLPASVKADLEQVGLAHQKVAVTRVEGDGNVATTVLDLTPRTGDSEADPALTVETRALPKIGEKISAIETMINTPSTTGNQALYTGLTRTSFTDVPTIIVSTGLDLTDPVDFRSLRWTTPAPDVINKVKDAGMQPELTGPVTFVTAPSAGAQPQLGQAERTYRNTIWQGLLLSAGATEVTFIDPEQAVVSPAGPIATVVPTLDMPGTPIHPITKPDDPTTVTCSIPGSYFNLGQATLAYPDRTAQDLAECVTKATAAGADFKLDGWTSYEGALTLDGQPAVDEPFNRSLSQQRVDTIAQLLIEKFGVAPAAITRKVAHGNTDLPHPENPRSEKNRTVQITYTVPAAGSR